MQQATVGWQLEYLVPDTHTHHRNIWYEYCMVILGYCNIVCCTHLKKLKQRYKQKSRRNKNGWDRNKVQMNNETILTSIFFLGKILVIGSDEYKWDWLNESTMAFWFCPFGWLLTNSSRKGKYIYKGKSTKDPRKGSTNAPWFFFFYFLFFAWFQGSWFCCNLWVYYTIQLSLHCPFSVWQKSTNLLKK